jgi:hypothetical protein
MVPTTSAARRPSWCVLICSDKNAPPPAGPEMPGIVQGHMRVSEDLRKAGRMVESERLRPDEEASRVHVKPGQRQVMDGTFAETKEALGRFYLRLCCPRLRPRRHRRRPG